MCILSFNFEESIIAISSLQISSLSQSLDTLPHTQNLVSDRDDTNSQVSLAQT